MRARVVTLLVLGTVAAAGCGGGDDSSGEEKAKSPAASAERQKPKAKPDRKKKPSTARTKEGDRKPSDRDGRKQREAPPKTAEAALERTPVAERMRLVKGAARAAVTLAGLDLVGVRVADDEARAVKVLVGRDRACGANAADTAAIAKQIRDTVPTVRSVTVQVAGTGKSLAAYGSGCGQSMPDGPGRVVLSESGPEGETTTAWFTVRGGRWAIEYDNAGSYLQITPAGRTDADSAKLQGGPTVAQKRGVGRHVYSGAGTYRLQIFASGRWTLRVKDIR